MAGPIKTKSSLTVGQPRKRNRYLMVKTVTAIYIRKISDDQLHELDVISYAVSLSQIRRTPKFVDDDEEEERCA